jgi:lysophospholipase L1-like esterase
MRRRTLIVPPLTLLAALVAVECSSRAMDTDRMQHEAIAIGAGNSMGETWHQAGSPEWLATTEELGVDYLPDDFVLDDGGYHSRWPYCDFDHQGFTILALGDSTTRQSMKIEDGVRYGDLPEHTWPALLEERLGEDVQVCVAAENGFHPRDLAMMLAALQPRLEPDLVLALLCENDLIELAPRVRVQRGDALVFYRAMPERKVVPSLYWYPLYVRSEAYRFLHWRLAMALPGIGGSIRVQLRDAFGTDEALRRLDATPGQLGIWFLPSLGDDDETLLANVERLSARSGVGIRTVPLPQPRARFRRTDDDPVHMNIEGHERVVDAMLPWVQEALGR